MRDAPTRAAIGALHGVIDAEAVATAWEAALRAAWEAALRAREWGRAPVWLHGDLQSGNLLAVQGRLSAVIDFGCRRGRSRVRPDGRVDAPLRRGDVFRAALSVDDATWARGRGWALSVGLIALPYYESTNPVLAEISRRAINEVLADLEHGA